MAKKAATQTISNTPTAPQTAATSVPATGATYTVGLDIGYGVTKAISPGRDAVTFQSVAGHARKIKFRAGELSSRYPGDQLTDDAGAWFIGDLAMSQLLPGELLRLRGRTSDSDSAGNEFRVRLMVAALGKLFAGTSGGHAIHINLATGLPVDHMPASDGLKTALIGQHLVKTDTADFVANVVNVAIMPQPYGTLYSQMFMPNGSINICHKANRTGVLDVGTYTTDVTLDDDGEYIDSSSGSIELGISSAQERIGALLEAEYGEKPTYKAIESTLRTGCYTAFGKSVDYSDAVTESLETLRSAVLNLLSERWKVGASIDVVYLAGGGAPLVYDLVKAAYPQTELVRDPQMANARGYLNYALAVNNPS
jgi:plasmid segregation protein ParM